ncbi:MAG: c-type cytochrome biogenesis protein CcmI [Arenicellales bacterium]|nr:c-type cytochrome biogenesis protein CcmI [Gammaproteobacteria bacterium]
MLTLWLAGSALLLGTLGALLPALVRLRPDRETLTRSEANIAIARERERETKRQLEEGQISDAEYDAARAEIEQSLAFDLDGQSESSFAKRSSPLTAAAISALLPIAALGLYLNLGSPNAPSPPDQVTQTATPASSAPDIETMLGEMRAKLADRPDDQRGWGLLANALMATGRYDEAVPAYRHLLGLSPNDPETIIRLADAIAMTQGGALAGEPEGLISQALQIQPNHPQGLWLFGISKEQQGAFDQALVVFQRLAPMVANEPEVLSEVNAVIARIESQIVGNTPGSGSFTLKARIEIAPQWASAVTPGDTLFLFARVPDGPPMPIAARRTQSFSLPLQWELSDLDLLMSGQSLSDYPVLQIGVRISKSGSANRSPGDLSGLSERFAPKNAGEITIVVDQQAR